MSSSPPTLLVLASRVLGLLACAAACQAQSAESTSAIPPKTFYRAALQDRARIAPYPSVATWLEEGSAVLLDLRSPQEFNAGHIKGAINLPATDLTDESLSKVVANKSSRVVIYCANNLVSPTRRVALTTMAYPTLKQLGYTNVLLLESARPGQHPFPIEPSPQSANTQAPQQ